MPTAEPIAPQCRPTLVDPYHEHLRTKRTAGHGVPVLQLFREIKEQGCTGSLNNHRPGASLASTYVRIQKHWP